MQARLLLQRIMVYTHCYSIRAQFEFHDQSCAWQSSVVNTMVFHAPGPRIDTLPGQIFLNFPGKKNKQFQLNFKN